MKDKSAFLTALGAFAVALADLVLILIQGC